MYESYLSPEYLSARDLMEVMVANSQRPGEGNLGFVEALGSYLYGKQFCISTVSDPELADRALLVVDVGDPDGEEVLSAFSHSDVVGVDGQTWYTDPWKLNQVNDRWVARGACDTHASGTAMLLAAARSDVSESLRNVGKRARIIFTYDEEDPTAELSFRGVRMAVGGFGNNPMVTSKYFIVGEPTEIHDQLIAMRANKGRWLASFNISVERAGHSAEDVQNALTIGAALVTKIASFAQYLRQQPVDEMAGLFNPPYSSAQVTAADVKKGGLSITPSESSFTVDLRTVPGTHASVVRKLSDLIVSEPLELGASLRLGVIDDFAGSATDHTLSLIHI